MKKSSIILIAVLLVAIGAFFVHQTKKGGSGVSNSDKQALVRAIKDPFVQHIRTALDNFNTEKIDGYSTDLKPYTEYLKSKFVLMEIDNNAVMGGKTMVIIFTDKPDKAFYVWVYKQGDGSFDLRALQPLENVSAEQAQQMYESSRPLIEELGLAV